MLLLFYGFKRGTTRYDRLVLWSTESVGEEMKTERITIIKVNNVKKLDKKTKRNKAVGRLVIPHTDLEIYRLPKDYFQKSGKIVAK